MDTTGVDKLIPQMTTFGGRRTAPVLRSVTEWGSYPLAYPTRGGDWLCADCATEQVHRVGAGETTFDPGDMLTGDAADFEQPPDYDVTCEECGKIIAEGTSE